MLFISSLLAAVAAWTVAFLVAPAATPDVEHEPLIGVLFTAGAALLAFSACVRGKLLRFGALSGLVAIGQAAALEWIEAPRYAVYQHYVPWSELLRGGSFTVIAGLLLLQLLVCAALAYGERAKLARLLREIGPWRGALLLGAFAFSAAVPTESIARALGEISLSLLVTLVSALNLLLAVLAAPDDALERGFATLSARISLTPGQAAGSFDARLPRLLALLAVILASLAAWFVLGGLPHIDDSVAYLFQAKTLSTFAIALPAPPDAAAFDTPHLINDGVRWYSKYFPGWPALLALGVLVGAPWLVNPVLAGVTVLVSHGLLRRLTDLATANLVAILLVCSPWFLFMSASHMAHPAAALCTVVAVYSLVRERQSPRGAWAVLSGLSLGLLFLTRPLDAVLVGLPLGLWGLGVLGARLPLRSLAGVVVAGAAVTATVLPYNRALTGKATYSPFALWSDRTFGPGADVLGFGPNVGIRLWPNLDPLPGHGLADVILNTNKNLFATQVELFGWAAGSLLFVAAALAFPRFRRGEAILLAWPACLVIGQHVYWFAGGPDFGARYWYPALLGFVFLSVRGMQVVAERAGELARARAYRRVLLFAAVAVACAWVSFVPWRATTKYYRYRDIGRHVGRLASQLHMDDALVFVRSEHRTDYQAAFSFNPPTLQQRGTIFARDAGPESRRAVIAAFPTRPIWLLELDPKTQRLTATRGPLPPGSQL